MDTHNSLEDATTVPLLLDDLQRVHLQLAILEYRSTLADYVAHDHTNRLSELADEVQSIMERLFDTAVSASTEQSGDMLGDKNNA